MEGGHAMALHGGGHGGLVTFEALPRSHFLVLSGTEIREPVVGQGPFVMNDPLQIEEAGIRYRTGAMGHLARFHIRIPARRPVSDPAGTGSEQIRFACPARGGYHAPRAPVFPHHPATPLLAGRESARVGPSAPSQASIMAGDHGWAQHSG